VGEKDWGIAAHDAQWIWVAKVNIARPHVQVRTAAIRAGRESLRAEVICRGPGGRSVRHRSGESAVLDMDADRSWIA